jgi:hypothetical protein
MPDDPTPPPAPEPPPATPAVPRQQRGLLNQAQLDALTKAEQITLAALKPAYAAKLAAGDIAGTFVEQLKTDCGLARKKGGDAIQGTTGKESATATEAAAQKALVKAIQTIQSRARQKYFFSDPDALTAYYIGTDRIDANRAILEQVSQAIIDKLVTDTLPGVTAAQKTALADRRADYVNANTTQSGAQSDATTARTALEAMLKSITQRRMTIQFAADAEWPWHDPASAGIRKEFHLPPGGPFTG